MPHNLSPASKYIFNDKPKLIYVELTRSCDLACKHCRAEALLSHDPLELKEEEAYNLLTDIKGFGAPYPHVVLTGGDPLKHPYVFNILAKGKEMGIGMSLSPSATKNLSAAIFKKMKSLNVGAISLSLDGASAETHDAFRGVPGCFDDTMKAAALSAKAGIPIQINTLVSENTIDDLPLIYDKIKDLEGIMRWSVFFLISVGRGTALKELSPDRTELVMHWLAKIAKDAPFPVKTTEAPHFRRVSLEREKAQHHIMTHKQPPLLQQGFGIRDANGIMFISHQGDVYPSGFMPLNAGNVRQTSIVEIYRNSEVFKLVRDPANLEGKCGDCEYRYICGGSRARAFAATGNPVGSDPLCPYKPKSNTARKPNAAILELA
jgi:AdoMet-dependent heme synthase